MKACIYILAAAACIALGMITAPLSTTASTVDHSASGIVALANDTSGTVCALDENGVAWHVYDHGRWTSVPVDPVPVPVSEIKFWNVNSVITYENIAWVTVAGGAWECIGSWPGGGVMVEPTTWGKVKAEYR